MMQQLKKWYNDLISTLKIIKLYTVLIKLNITDINKKVKTMKLLYNYIVKYLCKLPVGKSSQGKRKKNLNKEAES